ncbi:MAG: hypothetical protein P4L82_21920 [Ancalomicrobiaceae bacterium]|nr:hypothetical protein [Ancalomicrobiaceae bacterium]
MRNRTRFNSLMPYSAPEANVVAEFSVESSSDRPTAPTRRARAVATENGTAALSNWKSSQYYAILSALRNMSKLSTDDEFYLDALTSERAQQLIGILSNNFDIDAPRLLPHDQEAIALTWELGMIKKYLTICKNEIDLMELNRKTNARIEENLNEGEDLNYKKLIEILDGRLATRAGSI